MATARAKVKEKKTALAGVRRARRGARTAKPDVAPAAYRQALERQAVTAEILRVIAAAPHDTDAIFKAITQAGRRLMPDVRVSLFIVRDAMIHYVSHSGVSLERRRRLATLFPIPLDRKSISGSAILEKRVHTVTDTQAPEASRRYERTARTSRITGSRASIAIPLLTKGSAVGALNVTRSDPVAPED